MAFKADYVGDGKNIQNAIVCIERIWGSPTTGWHATVFIFASNKDTTPAAVFNFNIPFKPGVNPYEDAYSEMGRLEVFSNVMHAIKVPSNEITIDHLRKERASTVEEVIQSTTIESPKKRKKKST
jgi:hypothetical protein